MNETLDARIVEQACTRHENDRSRLGEIVSEVWLRSGGVSPEAAAKIAAGVGVALDEVQAEVAGADQEYSRVLWEIIEKHGRDRRRLPEMVVEARQRMGRQLAFHVRQLAEQVGQDRDAVRELEPFVHELLEHRDRSSRRKSSKIVALVLLGLGTLITGLSLVYLGYAVVGWQAQGGSSTWPTTPGRVQSSGVVFQRGGHGATISTYHVFVRYEYDVAGVRRTSRTIGLGSTRGSGTSTDSSGEVTPLYGASEEAKARALAAEYPVGKRVLVHYNPKHPSVACLEPGDPPLLGAVGGILFPLAIGLVLGIAGAVTLVFARRSPDPRLPSQ